MRYIKKNIFWIVLFICLAIYIALMIYFTKVDYDITNSLYNPNSGVWRILEVVGPIFMPFAGIYSIVSIVMNTKPKTKPLQICTYLLIGLLYLYYVFMGSFSLKYSYMPILFVPSLIAYAIWTYYSIHLNKLIAQKNLTIIHKKIFWIVFWTVFVAMVGSDIIKITFGRIRYINLNDKSEFLPWYVVQGHALNSSFPSGHASRCAIALVFTLVPLYYNNSTKAKNIILYSICFAFIGLVCFSRLIEGMHYPTDLLTGAMITICTFFVSKHILLNPKKVFDK